MFSDSAPQATDGVGYTARMVLILVALGLAVFGTIRLTRELEPGQRAVAWVVFVLVITFVFWKLVESGILGRATGAES